MRVLTLLLVAAAWSAVQGTPPRSIALVGGTVVDVSAFGTATALNADRLVLNADPTADVANLKKIDRVMLAGALIDRAALLHIPK